MQCFASSNSLNFSTYDRLMGLHGLGHSDFTLLSPIVTSIVECNVTTQTPFMATKNVEYHLVLTTFTVPTQQTQLKTSPSLNSPRLVGWRIPEVVSLGVLQSKTCRQYPPTHHLTTTDTNNNSSLWRFCPCRYFLLDIIPQILSTKNIDSHPHYTRICHGDHSKTSRAFHHIPYYYP
jgi:hypothetical protein